MILIILIIVFSLSTVFIIYVNNTKENIEQVNNAYKEKEEIIEAIEETPVIVYDNMTIEQLTDKLNKSLSSTISGKGELIANKSLELNIDPYLAVAIILHETGCKWECSYLVKACNNVGGQKGSPGCNGGSYKSFNTLDEGIEAFLNNLYKNYYAYGLTTAELMQKKYASSDTWAVKVNNYIESIKAK